MSAPVDPAIIIAAVNTLTAGIVQLLKAIKDTQPDVPALLAQYEAAHAAAMAYKPIDASVTDEMGT